MFQFNNDTPSIVALKNFLVGEVKPWLQQLTGIEDLNDTVDMFCAKYAHTDHLLCHDDKLEGEARLPIDMGSTIFCLLFNIAFLITVELDILPFV